MKTVSTTSPASNPAQARTRDLLIETIRHLVDHDGAFVEPGSIDSNGFNLIAGVFRYRLELTDDPELMEWDEHTRLRVEHDRMPGESQDRDEMNHEDYQRGRDFDWMAEPGDDVAF
jgi:hypothetical protein